MQKNKYILIIILFLFSAGCLEDNINEVLNLELESGALLLTYFEEQGDIINTEDTPWLIDVSEVYENQNNYLIIDVRTSSEFGEGHIQNAVNVTNTELLGYVQTNNNYSTIVIVSQDGQASAYYTCLLRLYGYDNIYSMDFGMAYWNEDFADDWLHALWDAAYRTSFNNTEYPKGSFQNLPVVFEEMNDDIATLAKERIASIITDGFVNTMDEIPYEEAESSLYLVCYGISDLYYFPNKFGTEGHPPYAVFYQEAASLQSGKYLQTLPTDKEILIYDYNGQLSAAVTAYLNVMGYQAYSLLYGSCHLNYETRMMEFLYGYAFKESAIQNYPYVTGQVEVD